MDRFPPEPEALQETSHEGLNADRGGSGSSHDPWVDFLSLLSRTDGIGLPGSGAGSRVRSQGSSTCA